MSAKRRLLTNLLLPTMMLGMMGANTYDRIPKEPKSPPRPRGYTPKGKTDEERIQHKLHQKKIKARRNARRRKSRR